MANVRIFFGAPSAPGEGDATAVGTSAATAIGASIVAAAGSSSSVGSAPGIGAYRGATVEAGVGSASGVGAAEAVGVARSAHGVGSAAGAAIARGYSSTVGSIAWNKKPDSWTTITKVAYPSLVATSWRFGRRALSDRTRFVEPRVLEYSKIERPSSERNGHYAPARFRARLNDDDGVGRTMWSDASFRHLLLGSMAKHELLSYTSRKTHLSGRAVFQGRVVRAETDANRKILLEFQDLMGSLNGPLAGDRLIGKFIGGEHANLPEETKKYIYNVVVGELSDIGAQDEKGNAVDPIGVLPARDCGDTNFASPGTPATSITAPRNLTATYVGSGTPTKTNYYQIVGSTALGGMTPKSNIISVEVPEGELDVDDYVQLNWLPPLIGADQVVAYFVLGRSNATPNKRLDTMNNGGTFINPETSYRDGRQGSRTDYDSEKSFTYKGATAVVEDTMWTWFACSLGEREILGVYGSDLAKEAAPKRVALDINGGDILTAESVGWPEANPYRVVGGIRQTGFWARGTRVEHHRAGTVTFAVNMCGPHDANEKVVNQAYRMLLVMHNDQIEKNNGEGYLDHDEPSAIDTYADGTAKFFTQRYELAQIATADLMGNSVGFIGGIAITEQITVDEFHKRFFTTFGGHLTTNHASQFYPFVIDNTPLTFGRLFRERMEIKRLELHAPNLDEQQNRLRYQHAWNPDANVFRSAILQEEDLDSIAAHGGEQIGVRGSQDVHLCHYSADPDSMQVRWAYEIELYAWPPWYAAWATDLSGIEQINGDPARFTHRKEGLGASGYVKAPCTILASELRERAKGQYEVLHVVRIHG